MGSTGTGGQASWAGLQLRKFVKLFSEIFSYFVLMWINKNMSN